MSPRFVAPLICLLAACSGGDSISGACAPAVDTVRNAMNSYADSGEPIARFAFQQLYTSYPSGCRRAGSGPIRLAITSTAVVPLAFSYQVRGYDQNAVYAWSFSGDVARIAPGETVDAGIIAHTSIRVDVKATVAFGDVTVVQ